MLFVRWFIKRLTVKNIIYLHVEWLKIYQKNFQLQKQFSKRLTPCKICKPPLEENNLKLKPNTPRGESNSVQCMGITKKGTRCKHMTKIANGYCFQHNPEN